MTTCEYTVGGGPEVLDTLELLADGVLAVPMAAEFASVSRSLLYEEMAAGRLPFVKRGRRRLIPKRALVRWLADGLEG